MKSELQHKKTIMATTSPKKQSWRKDPGYIQYCERGESAAVYIVRDLCTDKIDTQSKWIDCIALDAWQDGYHNWKFKFIVVEIFPRKIIPEYVKDDVAYNKYLTWKTAHEDIAEQRAAGVQGVFYLVKCWLINKNADKYSIEYQWYDVKDKCWIYDPALVNPATCEKREKHYGLPPDWGYRIDVAREITYTQAQWYKRRQPELYQ